jgi:hypothetical protein
LSLLEENRSRKNFSESYGMSKNQVLSDCVRGEENASFRWGKKGAFLMIFLYTFSHKMYNILWIKCLAD